MLRSSINLPYAVHCFILLMLVLTAFGHLAAQDNFSHRRIPLPENGTSDILNQFRMMQQLQKLMQERNKSKEATGNVAGDRSVKNPLPPPGLDPSMLQKLLQSLDPKQREAVEQMAKQLASPEGLPTPLLDQLKEDTKKTQDPKLRQDAQEEKGERLANPFDYLNHDPSFNEKANKQPSPNENGLSPTKPSLPPQSQLPSFEKENSTPWASRGSPWEDRGTRQPFPDPVPSDRSTNSNKDAIERFEQPSNEDKLPNVEDLLRQSKEQPESLPPLRLPPNVSDSVRQMFEQLMANQNPKSSESKFMEQLKGSLPPGLKEELRKSGVEQSMREVLQEARRAGAQSPSKPDVPPTLKPPSSMSRPGATDGIADSNSSNVKTKSWIEQITGQQQAQSKSTTSKSRNPNPQSHGRQESEKGKSLVESVTNIYKSMTTPEKTVPSNNAETSPTSPTEGESSSSPNLAWVALAAFAIAGLGMVAWMLFRTPQLIGDRGGGGLSLPAEALEIRDRGDIVRVFHQLATRAGIPTELWWPHPRAAVVMAAEAPWAQPAIDALTRLYEIARYTPDDQRLSESQLNEARQAVKQFHATEKRSIW
jgi:hypothetical protein